MTIIFLVAVAAWLGGMGLTYLMFAGIIAAERRREIYPALSSTIPVPVCHPDRHNQLTGAHQVIDDYESDLYAAGLVEEIETLERDAHEYRQEIRRLRDELAASRQARRPAPELVEGPVATPSRYNVIDKFAYLEVDRDRKSL